MTTSDSCLTSYLNNESVSWVRRRDSHILAVDREVFISDQRFIANIQKLSNLWILKVSLDIRAVNGTSRKFTLPGGGP